MAGPMIYLIFDVAGLCDRYPAYWVRTDAEKVAADFNAEQDRKVQEAKAAGKLPSLEAERYRLRVVEMPTVL